MKIVSETKTSSLKKFVGRTFIHTNKAIKKVGAPADRRYAVCDFSKDQEGEFLIAWKCKDLGNGKMQHPAFKKPIAYNDARAFKKEASSWGSKPTASFFPDSFYKEV